MRGVSGRVRACGKLTLLSHGMSVRNLRSSLRHVRMNMRRMSMTRWWGQGGVGSSSSE